MEDSSCPTENRCRKSSSRVQKKIELPQVRFKERSGGFQLYNREPTKVNRCHRCSSRGVKQKQIPVQRVHKKIEISQLQLAQETM